MKKYISIILGALYSPVYLFGFIVYYIARLVLALAYALMLQKRKAVDIITNFILVWNLSKLSIVVLFILVSWMTYKFIDFMIDPTRYEIVEKVERYTYLQETTMLLTVVIYLLVGKI